MMTDRQREAQIIRFRQMMKVRNWPEWAKADAKLRELGCTDQQIQDVRKGTEEVVFEGTFGTTDYDVASFVQQALSVLLHQGYEMTTLMNQPANEPYLFRSNIDRAWVVTLRQAVFLEANG